MSQMPVATFSQHCCLVYFNIFVKFCVFFHPRLPHCNIMNHLFSFNSCNYKNPTFSLSYADSSEVATGSFIGSQGRAQSGNRESCKHQHMKQQAVCRQSCVTFQINEVFWLKSQLILKVFILASDYFCGKTHLSI